MAELYLTFFQKSKQVRRIRPGHICLRQFQVEPQMKVRESVPYKEVLSNLLGTLHCPRLPMLSAHNAVLPLCISRGRFLSVFKCEFSQCHSLNLVYSSCHKKICFNYMKKFKFFRIYKVYFHYIFPRLSQRDLKHYGKHAYLFA